MRWISYFLLAYVTLGLQTGIARAMQVKNAGPNLVLLAVVFVGMNAPREAALLGAFVLGALQDLTSQGTMGLYCLSYALVAMFVVTARQALYREHPLTHFSLTLSGGLITAAVLAIHGWLRPPMLAMGGGPHAAAAAAVRPAVLPLFYTAIYSAVLAPFVLGVLQRMKRFFGFAPGRRVRWPADVGGR